MKLITTILLFFATLSNANYAPIPSKSALLDALATVPAGESLWIVGSMAESFEWQIVEQMSQEFPWQTILSGRQPPTFAEYRKIILDHGFAIEHTEVHREPVSPSDWASILPNLGLEGAPNRAYIDEFRKRCQAEQGGVYKQLLMKVALKS